MKKPLLLAILDGFAQAPAGPDNAISQAKTPNLTAALRHNPHMLLRCSGLAVGLPEGQMGNSEVGHTNIGAGRVVYQELTRITKEIDEGGFFRNEELLAALDHAKQTGGAVHLFGLLSDGGVHSHLTHLWALLHLCRQAGARTYLHCFLDGRDVPPSSGADYVAQAQEECRKTGAKIATVMGRFYAMDRDKRWDRLEKAYAAICRGQGVQCPDPVSAVRASYEQGVTDEFVLPVVCDEQGIVSQKDSVIFFNFRPDRARELTRSLVDPAFDGFTRPDGVIQPYFVCFTQYDAEMPGVHVAFKPEPLNQIFGQVVADAGKSQLRIAETEKYAHVTFFFNGGREEPFPGEDRVLIPSPQVKTYDMQPEMSAYPVTEACIERLKSGNYDVVILNLANCDMVGHTGVYDAAVKAVEAVDDCVGKLLSAMDELDGVTIITADHGNADQMRDAVGHPFTAHTTNPVPLILCGSDHKLREDGALCDIAPTMLELMGLPQPVEMSGRSLLAD